MALTLFPPRSAIGNANVGGQTVPVMMTPEFARALADLFVRIGGDNAMTPDQIIAQITTLTVQVGTATSQVASLTTQVNSYDAAISSNTVSQGMDIDETANVAVLRAEVAALRAELAMLTPAPDLTQQLANLATTIGMQQSSFVPTHEIVSGSRASGAALLSLLTQLSRIGLIRDNTTA